MLRHARDPRYPVEHLTVFDRVLVVAGLALLGGVAGVAHLLFSP